MTAREPPPPTDEELLTLLREKTPAELSPAEIALLRTRLESSPLIREALETELALEGFLIAALAPHELPAEKVLAAARTPQTSPSRSLAWVLLLLLPITLLMGVVLRQAFRPPQNEVARGERNPAAPTAPAVGAAARPGPVAVAPNQPEQPPPGAGAVPPPAKPKPVTAAPPQAQPAPPSPPPKPWQAVVDRPGVQPDWSVACFDEFDLARELPRRELLAQWFAPAPGFSFRLADVYERGKKLAALDGVARLQAPWLDDSSLRLWVENCNRLQLHVYHGAEGVTLSHHEDQWFKRWAAYATRRKAGAARPESITLTCTDAQRCRRTEVRFGGSYELAYDNGQLTLYRGDVPLVSAPLKGPPQEVYFDGKATFLGLALARTSGPRTQLPRRETTLALDQPGQLAWRATNPKLAQPQPAAGGAVRLAGDNLAERAECWAPLPRTGLHEVVLQLSGITPGSGVYLTSASGKPHWVVRFQKNRRSGRTCARLAGWDDAFEADLPPMNELPEPVVNDACWVSLLYGCGQLRWAISTDGVQWAEVEPAQPDQPGEVAGIGLQIVARAPAAGITLARLELRALTALEALGPDGWRERAVAAPALKTFAEWRAAVAAQMPANLAPGDWLRACALRTLAAGAPRELAHALLEAVLDDSATKARPWPAQLAALEESLLLTNDYRDQQSLRIGVPRRIINLGARLPGEPGALPWSAVRGAWFRNGWVTYHQPDATPEPLIRGELLHRLAGGDWAGTIAFCRMLRFLHLDEQAPLCHWAETAALREAGLRREASSETVVRRAGWEPLLIESLSKEAYNFMSELQSLLESEAWGEGGRMITALDPAQSPGLAPYLRDKQLLASLPVVVRLTLRDQPQLREALGEQFGPLAKLRIGQAVAAGDSAALALAAVQFEGTPESAAAHLWLGDRALARGWFAEALAHYDRALAVRPGDTRELAPRRRLAAAMIGVAWGEPVTAPVAFGELALSAGEFESLVQEMRARAAAAGDIASEPAEESLTPLPAPTTYSATAKARLDGPVGDKPQEEVNGRTNSLLVPWADRQLAVVKHGPRLYAANRFQVAAYELPSGKRLWQSQPPSGSPQRAQEWTGVAMRPLVSERRIIARQLYSRTPQLAAWSPADGKLQWSVDLGEREWIASDPVLLHGKLIVLSVNWRKDQQAVVRWNVVDEATGEFQEQRDLFEVRSLWRARTVCETTASGDALYAVLGGVTACIGPGGELRWLRKSLATPPDEDRKWILQSCDRPQRAGDQLLVAQPGVRQLECLALDTGARRWQAVLPSLIGLAGVTPELALVRTEEGLRALSLQDGKQRWERPLEQLQPSLLCDGKQLLAAVRVWPEKEPQKKSFQLVWIDAATGQIAASSPLGITHDDPRLGPLVIDRDRLWLFAGKGQHDPTRDLLELAPSGPPAAQPLTLGPPPAW